MNQYCDHIDVAFCERDSFEAIFDDAPDYVGFAQAVTSTRILGYFASVEALTEAVPNPNIGDTYGIGEEAPYNLFVYSTNGWIDNGVPSGPPGPPGPQGNDGAQGPPGQAAAVTAWEVRYQASASGTTIPTGTWSASIPEVPDGQFLWTRTQVTYSDGTTTTSYSVVRGVRGATGAAATVSVGSVTTGAAGSSATVTNSGTTAAAVLDFVIPKGDKGDKGTDGSDADVTADNIETALGFKPLPVSNPNLLDNWWLKNGVINQKATTTFASVTSATHLIDRWVYNRCTGSVTAKGISFAWDGRNGTEGYIQQRFESNGYNKALFGKTVTVSIEIDGQILSGTCVIPSSSGDGVAINTDDVKVLVTYWNTASVAFAVTIFAKTTTAHVISKVKLELGNVSTLANDGVPDILSTILKCQRYLYFVGGSSRWVRAAHVSSGAIYFDVPVPAPMAIDNPSIDKTTRTNAILEIQGHAGMNFAFSVAGNTKQGTARIAATLANHGLTDASLSMANIYLVAEI